VNIERIATIAAKECVKQQVGLDRFSFLVEAYRYALNAADMHSRLHEHIQTINSIIEPANNGSFRRIAVRFPDFSVAVDAKEIPEAMSRLVEVSIAAQQANMQDRWIKDFLDVHPFVDGNGRTAWILRTWLMDEWSYPNALPNYYAGK